MTALVGVGFVVIVVLAFTWSRAGGTRSERRAMKDYGHALGVLGELSRRSGDSAVLKDGVRRDAEDPPHLDPGPHLFVDRAVREELGGSRAEAAVPSPVAEGPQALRAEATDLGVDLPADGGRSTAEGPGRASVGSELVPKDPLPSGLWGTSRPVIPPPVVAKLSFDDAALSGDRTGVEPGERVPRAGASGSRGSRANRGRHVLGGAAAAVALAAVAVVAARALSSAPPAHRATRPRTPATSPSHHEKKAAAKTVHRPKATVRHQSLTPTSTSTSDVAFTVPVASYTLTFSDPGTADCWIGVETSVNGPWLWMTTLTPGQTVRYKATGSTVVKLGAPRYVGVTVNGSSAELPGYSLPYDLTFTPGSGPANA